MWIILGFSIAYGFHFTQAPSIFNAKRNITITFRPGAQDNSTTPGAYPNQVTVNLGQLSNVVWQNDDSVSHSVVISGGSLQCSTPVSYTNTGVPPGGYCTVHFSTPGTYAWSDPNSPWLNGVITVLSG
jgi:plastocyanin